MGWVKPGKRREIPGRPVTWMTTPEFMDHFGLESLRDLPGVDELRASGLLDSRPAIETLDLFDQESEQIRMDAGAANDSGDMRTEKDEDLELLPSSDTMAEMQDADIEE